MQKYRYCYLLTSLFWTSCAKVDLAQLESKAAKINRFEEVAITLAKENREQKVKIKSLEFEIQKLKQGGVGGADAEHSRSLASEHEVKHEAKHEEQHETKHETKHEEHKLEVGSLPFEVKKDFIEMKTYKWKLSDLEKMAKDAYSKKDYEKAAQCYTTILNHYGKEAHIDDEFLNNAGTASLETGEHHPWTIFYFQTLMQNFPTSNYFRTAKLWVALTHFKMGDKKAFFMEAEEFRKKYRNSKEWTILSEYYENIAEKTHGKN